MQNSANLALYIEYGKVGQFLISDFISKKAVFGNPYYNPTQPLSIYCATQALINAYAAENYSANVNSIAQYQYSLYSGFIGQIRKILGNAVGIVVTPDPTNVRRLVKQRHYPQFRIGDANSPMDDGDTELIIVDPDIAPPSKDGEVDVHADGILDPEALNDRVSFNAIYSPGQYRILFNSPVRDGQVYQIEYPINVNLTYSTSIAPTEDLTYFATVVSDETKTLRNTQGDIFTILAGTINVVNFTMFCVSTVGESYIQQWTGSVTNIGGTITINESNNSVILDQFNGGLTVNIIANDSEQGVEIQVTGIVDKIINCRATFNYKSNSL